MRIKITVKNGSVNFKGQEIDLDRLGIYHVVGPNGVGKTTILKDIVFSKRFNDENRNHFSYIEQDPEKYEISIERYLTRLNSDVNLGLMRELVVRFGLSELNLKDSLANVSGGELVKLNIVSALVKNTDYLFLDEPTNNLDDSSVESLKEVLLEISLKKVVVVISHDPRFKFENSHIVKVNSNSVEVEYNEKPYKALCEHETKFIKYPLKKIFLRYLSKPATIFSVFLLAVYFFPVLAINHMVFSNLYIDDGLANQDDSLLIYAVDNEFGESNKLFAECVGVTVDEKNFNSIINYSDIVSIAQKPLVEEIYIANDISWGVLWEKFNKNTLASSSMNISIPNIITDNYMYQICPYLSVDYLTEGRYPRDGQNEIVLSQGMIDRMYPQKSVNDIIVFEEEEYTIVGIQYFDFCITSYSGENDWYYKYNPDTYQDFIDEQIKHKNDLGMGALYVYKPENLIIESKTGGEKDLLLELFSEKPANNYRSHFYDKKIAEYNNKNMIKWTMIINAAAGGVLGALFLFLNFKKIKSCLAEAKSFDNYYLVKGATLRAFGITEVLINVLMFAAFVSFSYLFSTYVPELFASTLCFFVLVLFSIIPHLEIWLKRNDF